MEEEEEMKSLEADLMAYRLCLIFFPHCYERVQNKIKEYTEQQSALSVQGCPSLEEEGLGFYVCI